MSIASTPLVLVWTLDVQRHSRSPQRRLGIRFRSCPGWNRVGSQSTLRARGQQMEMGPVMHRMSETARDGKECTVLG